MDQYKKPIVLSESLDNKPQCMGIIRTWHVDHSLQNVIYHISITSYMLAELSQTFRQSINAWSTAFLNKLPDIVVAVIIVLLFYFLAKIVRMIAIRSLRRLKTRTTLIRLLSTTLYIIVILLGLFFALGVLELDTTVKSLLAGVGIIGLALGFAFQDLASNYISGIIIAVQKPFKRGDQLETNNHFGTVEEINLRTTKIITLDGLSVLVPNKDVIQNSLTNYTETDDRRVELDVGISYADDLEKVKKVTIDAVRKIKEINTEKPVDLFYKEFGDSSINFVVRFWIRDAKNRSFLDARDKAIVNIKSAYDREGITIPWPIRTIDFGIKGGEKLDSRYLSRQ